MVYPNEELPAARPNQTTPMYDIFDGMGAVWGQQNGLEVVNYFALEGENRYETPSFRRSNAWEATAQEVKAVRNSVGINEVQNFGKFLVRGLDARVWLDRIMAGRIPQVGRLSLTPMLAPSGRLIGDFTVSCLAEDEFQLTGSYGAQEFHHRWFLQHLAEGVSVENISDQRTGFQIAGPNARKLLERVTRADVSSDAFKFLDVRPMAIGLVDCLVQRVSYTGDLGYEIYTTPMSQRALWTALWDAGQDLGLRPFGMRAMMSLRLDKFFGGWLREFSPDYTAAETGLDRFISFKKSTDFVGRAAAEAERETPPARMLCAFEVTTTDAEIHGYEPVFVAGKVVGYCTSGGYSHFAKKSIAMALIPRGMVRDGLQAEIEVLGEMCAASLITTPLFDADGARMRG